MTPNYLDIIGTYFPATQAELKPGGNPKQYQSIIWKSTPIAQSVLDQYSTMVPAKITAEINTIEVFNDYSHSITKGQLVKITGTEPLSGLPIVELCDFSTKNTLNCIGIVTEDILSKSAGHVMTYGIIEGIDTGSTPIGTELFVGPSGTFTNVMPTLSFYQRIGYVCKAGSNGSVLVKIARVEDHSADAMSIVFGDNSNPFVKKNNNNYTTVARFIFRGLDNVNHISNIKMVAWCDFGTSAGYCRLVDITNNNVICEINNIQTATSPSIFTFPAINNLPQAEAIIEVQVKTSNYRYCYISSISMYS